jgi:hypothetical protein
MTVPSDFHISGVGGSPFGCGHHATQGFEFGPVILPGGPWVLAGRSGLWAEGVAAMGTWGPKHNWVAMPTFEAFQPETQMNPNWWWCNSVTAVFCVQLPQFYSPNFEFHLRRRRVSPAARAKTATPRPRPAHPRRAKARPVARHKRRWMPWNSGWTPWHMARRRYLGSLIYSNPHKREGNWNLENMRKASSVPSFFGGCYIYTRTCMYIYIYVYIHTTTQKDRKVIYHYISWNLFTFLSIWVGMKNKEIWRLIYMTRWCLAWWAVTSWIIYIITHVMLWNDCWVVTSFTDKKNIAL